MLLTSSLTMALAVDAIRKSKLALMAALIAATAVLGGIFFAIKGWEYWLEFERGLAPIGRDSGPAIVADGAGTELFFNCYFSLTGLHALHLIIGLGALSALLIRAARGLGRLQAYVKITGLYWHFVDLVWVFLFPVLYLVDR